MISVIIPTYNRARTIERSVSSVRKQSYQDIEIIVVDDCSTDETESVIKSMSDCRITYYKLERNSGACTARNKGIELAHGEYIAFQDSDDEWHENKLDLQLRALLDNSADIVFCGHTKISLNNERKIIPVNVEEGFLTQQNLLYESLASTQTILGKSEAIKEIQFDSRLPRMQDYDFIIRASGLYSVYYLNQVLVNVYEQTDSITATRRQYQKRLEISRMLLTKHKEVYAVYPRCEVKMLKTIAHCEVMLHLDASKTLKEIIDKENTAVNKMKMVLYRVGLLKFLFKWTDR